MRRVAGLLVLLLGAVRVQALDPSTPPELARLADCQRIADKTVGAQRAALIAGCMEPIDPDGPAPQAGPGVAAAAQGAGERAARTGVSNEPMTAAGQAVAPAAGLPSQGLILGCAKQVKELSGAARSTALKACLAGPGVPVAAADTGQRRRAHCNVLAHDRQGEARKRFIDGCMAEAAARVPTAAE